MCSLQHQKTGKGNTHPFLANDDALETDIASVNVRSEPDHELRWQVTNLFAQNVIDSHSIGVIPGS